MSGFGPIYAACVLRPFSEVVLEILGDLDGRAVLVIDGDNDLMRHAIKRRGGVVAGPGTRADAAVALGTLGVPDWPSTTLAAMQDAVIDGGAIVAIHFTQASAHEAIAQEALDTVHAGAPDPVLTRLRPAALAGYTVTTQRDVARFDSPRQFYAALINERDADAGLGALQRQKILAYCTEALRSVTLFDESVRLPVEALMLVRNSD